MAARGTTLLALVVAVAATTVALAAPAGAGRGTQVIGLHAERGLGNGLLQEMNLLRRRHGLARLRTSPALRAAALMHSRRMAVRGFFRHESSDGSPFWKRVENFYGQGRYGYWSVGENLLWSSPNIDARRALRMWLASPPHRANLLDPKWREVGLAAVHAPRASGVYGGSEVTIVTADFGVRR